MSCVNPLGLVDKKTRLARVVPCGKCIGCLKMRAKDWTDRLIMESRSHDRCCFLTLTYADSDPDGSGSDLLLPRSVSVRDCQLFLKRFRQAVPERVRYFLAGEYGEKSFRAHYHLCVFGIGTDHPVFQESAFVEGKGGFSVQLSVWPHGFVFVAPFDPAVAGYVAGYLVKSVDPARRSMIEKAGLRKEFSLMSRRPGLGAAYVASHGDELKKFGMGRRRPGKESVRHSRFVEGRLYPEGTDVALARTDTKLVRMQQKMRRDLADAYDAGKTYEQFVRERDEQAGREMTAVLAMRKGVL